MINDKMTFNGKEYTFTPLRCKHLKKIQEIVKSKKDNPGPQSGYDEFSQWAPFLVDSLRVNHPDITQEAIEEMTLTEFAEALKLITELSGVQIVSGEQRAVRLNGPQSTADSALLSDTPIVM